MEGLIAEALLTPHTGMNVGVLVLMLVFYLRVKKDFDELKNTELKALIEKDDEMRKAIEELNKVAAVMRTKYEGHESECAHQYKRFERRMDGMGERFNKIDNKLSTLHEKLTTVGEQVAGLRATEGKR